MTADDDKALSWDGDDVAPAPTRVAKAEKPAADSATTVGDRLGQQAPSSALLIIYGVLGGVYLIYTIGWVVAVLNGKLAIAVSDALTMIMYQVGEYLAIASPAIWFVAAIVLTRGRRPIVRLLALILGLCVVVPWPFVLLGA